MSDIRIPKATVVVSTYNRPLYLMRALDGFARQSFQDFEIIIADDGSDAAAREAVDAYLADSPLPARRVWQEDRGFRKTTILNKAIGEAKSDYLIFTDGDCIPFPDFVAQHLALRAPRTFLSAGAIRLGPEITAEILRGAVSPDTITEWHPLVEHGMRLPLTKARMFAPRSVRVLLDKVTPIKKTFNGLNASCWKADAEKVGGFNEAMGYGAEDVEFGIRLQAAGVRPVRVRHRIRALHLDHDKPYATPDEIARNYRIRDTTARTLRKPAAS